MGDSKKAIILDLDETLAYGTFKSDGSMMTLRPNIDKLIDKLKQAKSSEIEVILATSTGEEWVKKFLKMKPEFNSILDRISYEDYDEEFDKYDSVLFISGNKQRNEDIVETKKRGTTEKDITYFSGFGFNAGEANLISMLKYCQYAQSNNGIAKRLQNYVKHTQKEPGCLMMCEETDSFLNKEYSPGIEIDDDKYIKEYNSYLKIEKKLFKDLIADTRKFEKQVDPRLYSTVLYLDIAKVDEYMETDKFFPYENLNVPELEEKRKAIILDLNETLVCGAFNSKYSMMTLRPNIDRLIAKLEAAKGEGIDIILHTMAPKKWVDRFLELKPEFKHIFNEIYTRQDQVEWMRDEILNNNMSPDIFLKTNVGLWKPVTEFDYDSILLIDDNRQEEYKLNKVFKDSGYELQKDITYFSGFGYNIDIKPEKIIKCQKIAQKDPKVYENFNLYMSTLKREPGCLFMADAIDAYINKPFEPGVTIADKKYEEIYKEYKKIVIQSSERLDDSIWEYEEKTGKDVIYGNLVGDGVSVSEEEIKEIFKNDKTYPYEGVETKGIENQKKQELNMLIAKAMQLQVKIKDAKKIMNAYENITEEDFHHNEFEV